jgi:proteic killer suppression protein
LTGLTLSVIIEIVIKSFSHPEAEHLFEGLSSRWFPADLQRAIKRKLAMLDASESLQDLRIPPSNCLEKLVGDRRGQYSIRINARWRLCFEWRNGHAYRVEIVDYH